MKSSVKHDACHQPMIVAKLKQSNWNCSKTPQWEYRYLRITIHNNLDWQSNFIPLSLINKLELNFNDLIGNVDDTNNHAILCIYIAKKRKLYFHFANEIERNTFIQRLIIYLASHENQLIRKTPKNIGYIIQELFNRKIHGFIEFISSDIPTVLTFENIIPNNMIDNNENIQNKSMENMNQNKENINLSENNKIKESENQQNEEKIEESNNELLESKNKEQNISISNNKNNIIQISDVQISENNGNITNNKKSGNNNNKQQQQQQQLMLPNESTMQRVSSRSHTQSFSQQQPQVPYKNDTSVNKRFSEELEEQMAAQKQNIRLSGQRVINLDMIQVPSFHQISNSKEQSRDHTPAIQQTNNKTPQKQQKQQIQTENENQTRMETENTNNRKQNGVANKEQQQYYQQHLEQQPQQQQFPFRPSKQHQQQPQEHVIPMYDETNDSNSDQININHDKQYEYIENQEEQQSMDNMSNQKRKSIEQIAAQNIQTQMQNNMQNMFEQFAKAQEKRMSQLVFAMMPNNNNMMHIPTNYNNPNNNPLMSQNYNIMPNMMQQQPQSPFLQTQNETNLRAVADKFKKHGKKSNSNKGYDNITQPKNQINKARRQTVTQIGILGIFLFVCCWIWYSFFFMFFFCFVMCCSAVLRKLFVKPFCFVVLILCLFYNFFFRK